MTSDDRPSNPVPCPQCRSPAGMPFRVTTVPTDSIALTLRCAVCLHEWVLTVTASPTLAPKPDRREDPDRES